ncbi:MAG: tRNA dihydrouridine synthase [Planctomycetota bacterium]|jgi:nifR3 family TIM-barrel protein
MLKLGDLTLNAPFFQAPLSGYSDYAMRKLAISCGAPLTFAGVMLAKSAIHPKILSKQIFMPQEDEHPIGAQILGSEAAVMAEAAKKLAQADYDVIDLNFACPAPKVLRRGRGGFLINQPEKAIEIFRRVREAVTCPVTIKLRTSFDDTQASREDFWQIASEASAEGVDALVVHGRSVAQRYKGPADWDVLAELKNKLPTTTVIGSGDLFDAEQIIGQMKSSRVDGVTIARGAIGNPWIYRDLKAVLKGKPKPSPPSLKEQGEMILKHFDLVCRLYPTIKAVRYLRKFLATLPDN